MKKSLGFCAVLLCIAISNFGQEPLDITEQTIKLGGFKEEELLFGFAEGDKIIFSFQEVNDKELKEVEIVEYPSNSKFSDYKTKKVEKTISVNKQCVYIFRFKNSAVGGRVCKIKIQRIAASEATKNFNSTVSWVNRQDTTWNSFTKDVISGYDTTILRKARKELVKIDTIIIPLFDKTMRVHSETAIGKTAFAYATVALPTNSYSPTVFNPYQSTEVVAWSYWMGVGQKAAEDYERSNKNLGSGLQFIGTLTGFGSLATLAATGVSLFSNTSVGDNVIYKFHCLQNGRELLIDYGNVISASGRCEKIRQGSFDIVLQNDNLREGINVNVKMVVLQVSKTWKDISYSEQKITARMEKKSFSEPAIKTSRVAVAGL